MTGYFYILRCAENTLYCGSTKDLILRFEQHKQGFGANFTRKYEPICIAYYEVYPRIDLAFYREKQVQKWSRAKKEALIASKIIDLKELALKKFK
ncbi:MAG: GIY-YIG nuclease family protein [Cycloclasticus sp.]|jgi:putative endonuclease|nr:GIY-YIG nuclease family protein [Cycloclasticus sp.]